MRSMETRSGLHCAIRWQEDEKCRNSRQPHGRTEEHCRYPDYLAAIDISHTAPWHHSYESTITLVCNDDDREAGPMREEEETLNPLRNCSQVFDNKKDDSITHFEERESEAKNIR